MMNKRYNTNYEDRIEFVIALMTKDYIKARDIGTQLLKYNSNDANISSVLDILKHRNQSEKPNCAGTSFDSLESDSEHKVSDEVSDNENSDFVDDNFTDIVRIDTSNIPSYNNSQLKRQHKTSNINEKQINFDFKEKMYRVISIKLNR